MINSIYKRHLLDLYSEQKNFGELKGKTHEIKSKNPTCTDEITLELKIKNKKILDAKFHGKLCFISAVSAEVLIEKIKGMKINDIKKLNKQDIDRFLGVEIIETRVGCELFPLETLKKIQEKFG